MRDERFGGIGMADLVDRARHAVHASQELRHCATDAVRRSRELLRRVSHDRLARADHAALSRPAKRPGLGVKSKA